MSLRGTCGPGENEYQGSENLKAPRSARPVGSPAPRSALVKPFYAGAINYCVGKTDEPPPSDEIICGCEKMIGCASLVSEKVEGIPGNGHGIDGAPIYPDLSAELEAPERIHKHSERKPDRLCNEKPSIKIERVQKEVLIPKPEATGFDIRIIYPTCGNDSLGPTFHSPPTDGVKFGLDPKGLGRFEKSVKNIRKEIDFSQLADDYLQQLEKQIKQTEADHYDISRVLHRKIDSLENKLEKRQTESWDLGELENEKENELVRLREQVAILVSENRNLKSQIQSRDTNSTNIRKELHSIRQVLAAFNQKLDNLKRETSETYQTLSNTLRKFHTECMQAMREQKQPSQHGVDSPRDLGMTLTQIIKNSMDMTEKLLHVKEDLAKSNLLNIGHEAEEKVNLSTNLIEILSAEISDNDQPPIGKTNSSPGQE